MSEEKKEPRFSLDEEKRKIISLLLQHVAEYHTEGKLWELYKNLNTIRFQIVDTLNKGERTELELLELKIALFNKRKKIPEDYEGIEIGFLSEEEQKEVKGLHKFNRKVESGQKKFIEAYEIRIIELLKEKKFFKEKDEDIENLETGT